MRRNALHFINNDVIKILISRIRVTIYMAKLLLVVLIY